MDAARRIGVREAAGGTNMLLERIRGSLSQFTPAERRVAETILASPHATITWSISDAARTYILKKSLDWATLSKLTGITKEELKALNGASEEQLKAFQPVRIPVRARAVSPEVFFIRL